MYNIEKCSKSLERKSLLYIAKTQYASLLEQCVDKVPTLIPREPYETEETISNAEHGLALTEFRSHAGAIKHKNLTLKPIQHCPDNWEKAGPYENRLFRVPDAPASHSHVLPQTRVTTSWQMMTFQRGIRSSQEEIYLACIAGA